MVGTVKHKGQLSICNIKFTAKELLTMNYTSPGLTIMKRKNTLESVILTLTRLIRFSKVQMHRTSAQLHTHVNSLTFLLVAFFFF